MREGGTKRRDYEEHIINKRERERERERETTCVSACVCVRNIYRYIYVHGACVSFSFFRALKNSGRVV